MTCRLFYAARLPTLAGVCALALCLTACDTASGPPLSATDLSIKEPLPGSTRTAAYLTLRNTSDTPIDITSVSSPQFARVEMHETIISDDVARMRPIPRLTIDGHSSVVFAPGGKHIMLMRPAGTAGTVTLHFHRDTETLLTINTTMEAR